MWSDLVKGDLGRIRVISKYKGWMETEEIGNGSAEWKLTQLLMSVVED